jgi:uncharacterized protein
MSTGELILTPPDQLLPSKGRAARPCRTPRLAGTIAGHLWTVVPSLLNSARPLAGPPTRDFYTTVEDPLIGKVRLTGLFSDVAESDTLVLILHGLAGNARSSYCTLAARAARHAGYASLRLSMRGADLSGEDIFHGGLTDDLRAALASDELARFCRVFLFGYSVGGHLALRAGIERIDPRIRAVAAICPPLDLNAATIAFDMPQRRIYRRHIFSELNKSYAIYARRRRVSAPLSMVKRARSCRERDALTVVPRFGFASEEDYYRRASVSTEIHRLQVPSLVVASQRDPIIPAKTLLPAIADASAALSVRWVGSGGHIFFPSRLDMGEQGRPGLESQAITWLGRQ